MVICNHNDFSTYATSSARQRHDYDSSEHLISEMMHDQYWQTVMSLLSPKDLIHVTDAEGASMEIRIDWLDHVKRTVGFSVLRNIEEAPMIPASGYTLKNRGPRGGFWCIIDAKGEIVRRDMRSQEEAQRHLADLIGTDQKAA